MGKKTIFFEEAKKLALKSNCLRKKVGCVIVNDGVIISRGFNGAPRDIKSCTERGQCYRIKHHIKSGTDYLKCYAVHAEMNAIIWAGVDKCLGADLYLYGHSFVCDMCKRFIVQAKISNTYIMDTENKITHFTLKDFKIHLEKDIK